MRKKEPSRKTKIRRLANQLSESLDDIFDELDQKNTSYNYISDFCDEIKGIVYDINGICYSKPNDL